MIKITIDNKTIETQIGKTVLEVATENGISIPTLCFSKECSPQSTCMVCAILVKGEHLLRPACSFKIYDGLNIESESAEVKKERQKAIELLLSEHKGDCLAPCERICPLGADIPKALYLLKNRRYSAAAEAMNIPLAGLTCYHCHAPCEKGCRRKKHPDEKGAVRIRDCMNFLSLYKEYHFHPNGTEIAVIGDGVAGLTAASILAEKGYLVTLIYKEDENPSSLQSTLDKKRIAVEVEHLKEMSVRFIPFSKFEEIKYNNKFRALVNSSTDESLKIPNVPTFGRGDGGGEGVRYIDLVKQALQLTNTLLESLGYQKEGTTFDSHFGSIEKEEVQRFAKHTSDHYAPVLLHPSDFETESSRCLMCDCKKESLCKLRDLATEFHAKQSTYRGERPIFTKERRGRLTIENGKCVKCGICVRITEEKGTGFCFLNRGFQTEIKIPPFVTDVEIDEVAARCAKLCPTGALSYENDI